MNEVDVTVVVELVNFGCGLGGIKVELTTVTVTPVEDGGGSGAVPLELEDGGGAVPFEVGGLGGAVPLDVGGGRGAVPLDERGRGAVPVDKGGGTTVTMTNVETELGAVDAVELEAPGISTYRYQQAFSGNIH